MKKNKTHWRNGQVKFGNSKAGRKCGKSYNRFLYLRCPMCEEAKS